MIAVDAARGMHVGELRRLRDDPVARRQVELRDAGTDIVLGVLDGLGYRYSGTGGWHITAYATPEHMLGLVNIAKGIAVLTSVPLDSHIVEALTVPAQATGPQVSGAAAWTSPDAGEGHRASAPEGWVQLFVDVRASARGEPYTAARRTPAPRITCRARVVRWGLATCYEGRPGDPGPRCLDPREGDEMEPIADWPVDRQIRRRMAAVADDRLRALAMRLAVVAGVDLEPYLARPHSPGLSSARRAAALPYHPFGYAGARDVATSVTYAAPHRLLREHGVTWCAAWETNHVAGASYHSLLEQLLRRILVQRLEPIAAAIREQLEPLSDMTPAPGQQEHMPLHALHAAMEPAVAASIDPIAKRLLGYFDLDTRKMTRPVRAELLAIYYSAGPVVVDIPHDQSGRRDS